MLQAVTNWWRNRIVDVPFLWHEIKNHLFNRNIHIVLHPAQEGGFWVISPQIKGLITQGDTIEESLEMALDAYRCLHDLPPYEKLPVTAKPEELTTPFSSDLK